MKSNSNSSAGHSSNTLVSCRVVELHEQGYPEIIELKYKGKWMRFQHFSKEHERRMNDYIKKSLLKHGS